MLLSAIISPIRAYLVGAAAVALAGGFLWYTIHERNIEHAKDVAVAAKVVAKVTKKDKATEDAANTEIQHDVVIFKQAISVPAVGDIGVVCEPARNNPVPGAAAGNGAGQPAANGGAGNLYDPSGGLLTIGRRYDAWIRELQAENAALRKELVDANKTHSP
jgi:hypothetical protein